MSKFVTMYPYKFNEEEQKVWDSIEKANKEQAGKAPMHFGHEAAPITVTEESLVSYANTWDEFNPLFCDPAYAKDSCWGGMVAFPGSVDPNVGFPMLDDVCDAFGEMFYYGNEGGDVEFYKPIRPGDVLKMVVDEYKIEDITNSEGEKFRRIQLTGTGSLYNEAGELVGKAKTLGKNAMQRFSDPEKVTIPSEYDQCFAWRNHYNAPYPRRTSEAEWEIIQDMWKNEKIRGKDTLYWEDVNVGDEPWPTCAGSISSEDMIRLHGETYLHFPSTRKQMASGGGMAMLTDPYGLKISGLARHYYDCHLPNNGALFYNHTARNFVLRMVTNWIGDAGLVTKYGWRFCNVQEPIFDPEAGADLLAKVPYMAGRFCDRHGIEGDCPFNKGYVVDKYKNENGCFIDMVCWAEDFEDRILQVVPVTVKLPSKDDK